MNVLHKIVIAGVDCLAPGGGGSPEFYKRQIEIMPDLDRAAFANLLKSVMPQLTAKFKKIGKYEAWFQTLLVEDRWYSKIRKDEFWQACRVGINDSNVTVPRLERNLHHVLDKCAPGWNIASIYEGDDLSVPNVEYYMLGELARAYPVETHTHYMLGVHSDGRRRRTLDVVGVGDNRIGTNWPTPATSS